jgi:monovalent cation:proton antiporter-2 (CPA2) family protein
MGGDGLLFQAFVYLSAAVVSVPLAKRLGLGSVLGYLAAGAVIGPFGLGLVGHEGQDVRHFAEFGVVMMLFLIGLELRPALLWRLRGPILGLGGLQVAVTALTVGAVAAVAGLGWQGAAAVGMILSLSSTAIVMQTLGEKGLVKTPGGQRCFAVLLFQDLAVIPMLALLPLLAAGRPTTGGGLGGLLAWQQAVTVALLIGGIVVGGKLLTGPVFRFIAASRLREVFTAAALLLVIGIALAMQKVGLSPALGTFLAGVVLADSEYRHELESDIEPFKGLLLGLFFIAVGVGIDFHLLAARPGLVTGLVAALVAAKFAVLLFVGRLLRVPWPESLFLSFALAQGGEFCFVLFSFATQSQVLEPEVANALVAVVALSMAITPPLMMLDEKGVQPRFATGPEPRPADAVTGDNPVIIAGFGRFGHIVGRLLKANGVPTTVLDLDPEQIETLRRFGLKVFYGDASRLDLLEAAGARRARLLLLAVDDPDKATQITAQVRRHFPRLSILARAHSLQHSYALLEAGADQVFRETLGTAVDMGVQALGLLGFRRHQAHRAGRLFARHERQASHELLPVWKEGSAYYAHAGERVSELERLLQEDQRRAAGGVDHAWEAAPPEESG